MAGGGVSALQKGPRSCPDTGVVGGLGGRRLDPTRPSLHLAYSLGYVGKERGSHEPQGRVVLSGSVCYGLSWWMPLSLSVSPRGRWDCLLLWLPFRVGWEDGSGAAMQVCDYLQAKPMDGRTGSLAGLGF